jgi:hypothetical protein
MAGVQFPVEAGTLLMLTSQPPVHGYCRLLPSDKGADHSPPSSPDVKNVWNFISVVPVCHQCLVHRHVGTQLYFYISRACLNVFAAEEQIIAFTLRNFCISGKMEAVSCCEIFTIPIHCILFFWQLGVEQVHTRQVMTWSEGHCSLNVMSEWGLWCLKRR